MHLTDKVGETHVFLVIFNNYHFHSLWLYATFLTMTQPYRHNGILAKLREQQVMDFSESELTRAFKHCISPICCKRGVAMMLKDGLTLQELYSLNGQALKPIQGELF